MTYKELKLFIETLTDEQLEQAVGFFDEDTEAGKAIDGWDISTEDIYWEHHGDCVGTYNDVKDLAKSEGIDIDDAIEDLIKVPKGTVSLTV